MYDEAGRVRSRGLGAADLGSNPLLSNAYAYFDWEEQGGRLAWMKTYTVTVGDTLQYLEYDYDNVSNRNWIKDYQAGANPAAPQTQSFGYDSLQRLTGATTTQLYTAWGEVRYSSAALPTSYQYTGQRAEPALGLLFYNARWYDSSLGRFTQADTLVPDPFLSQSWDRYGYVRNNPVLFIDPSGNVECIDEECRLVYNYKTDAIYNYRGKMDEKNKNEMLGLDEKGDYVYEIKLENIVYNQPVNIQVSENYWMPIWPLNFYTPYSPGDIGYVYDMNLFPEGSIKWGIGLVGFTFVTFGTATTAAGTIAFFHGDFLAIGPMAIGSVIVIVGIELIYKSLDDIRPSTWPDYFIINDAYFP